MEAILRAFPLVLVPSTRPHAQTACLGVLSLVLGVSTGLSSLSIATAPRNVLPA